MSETATTTLTVKDPPPATDIDLVLSQVAVTSSGRQELVCRELLLPAQVEDAKKLAEQLYPQMLSNNALFNQYGKDAVEGLNRLIAHLLDKVEPTEIPELERIMNDLSDKMRQIKGQSAGFSAETRGKYQNVKRKVINILRRGKTMLEMLIEDARGIVYQIDKVEKQLGGKEFQLTQHVLMYDELYVANEEEVKKVIFVIAVMEFVHELAKTEVASIVTDQENPPQERDLRERKSTISEFITNLEVKIGEYKNRLFVGWATSPQVRNIRTLDIGLASKLNELIILTLPVMRSTILQWIMQAQAQKGAEMAETVASANEEVMRQYAQAMGEAIPAIAKAVQTPSLTPEGIGVVADAISQAADNMIQAYHDGQERRKQVSIAIVEAQGVIADASRRIDDAVVNRVVEQAGLPVPRSLERPLLEPTT